MGSSKVFFKILLFFFTIFIPKPALCSVNIQKTVTMTMGSSTTIDPWSVVRSRYSGSSCMNTRVLSISDQTGVSVSTYSTTKTKYPTLYQSFGYSEGFYSTYKVKGLKTGSYTVTTLVRTAERIFPDKFVEGDIFVVYNVTVKEKPNVTSISIPNNLSLTVGESYTFSPIIYETGANASLTWTSSNPSVVSVENAQIRALTPGNSIITCTAQNGINANCVVTVNPIYINSVSINLSELEIKQGERYQLDVTVLPDNATNKDVEWSSSNENVAFVGANGVVIGISSGYCNISANAKDGSEKRGTCLVHVCSPIVVSANSYTRMYGESNPEFGYTVSGGVLEGVPEVICDATPSSPVGTYPVRLAKGSVTSYNVEYVEGTLTVASAPLTATARSYTRKQGEPNPEFEIDYSGFMNGEDESALISKPIVTTSANQNSDIGDYEICIHGGSAKNYDIIRVNGVLSIVKPTDVVRNIENIGPGCLPGLISDNDKMQITTLKLSGELNGTDIRYLREMIFSGNLKTLDAQNTSIVSGGEAYYDGYLFDYYTKDNVLGEFMFNDCEQLETLLLPSSITSIRSMAISNCIKLKEIIIPSLCEEIENYAINHCERLETVVISPNIKKVSPCNFDGCPNLKSIEIKRNDMYESDNGILFTKGKKELVKYPMGKDDEFYSIDDCVTTIGEYSFEGNLNLKKILLSNAVNKIGNNAFANCKMLSNITLPDGLTEIENFMLYNCVNLKTLTIPANVTAIGTLAFAGCSSLTKIISNIPDASLIVPSSYHGTSADINAFEGIPEDCVWNVVEGSQNTYTKQPWWVSTWTIIDNITSRHNKVLNENKISWFNGSLNVLSSKNETIYIYTINGSLIKSFDVKKGELYKVELLPGIYIINNKKYLFSNR